VRPGRGKFVAAFAIAGIACRVECEEEAFRDLVSSRYAEFASAAPPEIFLRVEVTATRMEDVAARWSGPFARVGGRDGILAVEGAGFSASFDERSGRGWITQPLDLAPFDTFVTAIYAGRLLRAGGFFLHAAAVVAAGEAQVFFGPSGSGKTTVAELVGEGVISDEIVAIRRDGDRYRVFGVPWRGRRLSAPLGGLFRLRKGQGTSFTSLTPVETVRQLLPSVFFSAADSEEVGRFLEIAGELLRTVPGYDMQFALDRSFWETLSRRGKGENLGHSI